VTLLPIRNVIFDMDGTLVDSLPGITASASHAISAVLPGQAMPDLASHIGPPIAVMFARLWPALPVEQMESLIGAFRHHYATTGWLGSKAYFGVTETLEELRTGGVSMFVLTNKPLSPARRILERARLNRFFRDLMCPDSCDPPFERKSDGAKALAQRFGLQPAETVVMGDGIDDAVAAAECGFGFIAAAYGYGTAGAGSAPSLAVVSAFSEVRRLVLGEVTA
jgi:phosphoglycolate phosphatase